MAQCIYRPITLSNIKIFTVGIRRKCVVTLSLNITPHLACVATLPGEMSDIAWTQAGDNTDLLRDQHWSSLTCVSQTTRT